jgi:hypothetical protein
MLQMSRNANGALKSFYGKTYTALDLLELQL